MRNNNRAVIRKLTRRTLGANKIRNFFIAVAIALTAFMMAAVFSIGASWIASVNMMPYRIEGINSHMGFIGPTPDQMKTLRGLPYVRDIGVSTLVGTANVAGMQMPIRYVDYAMWTRMQIPTFTRLVGRYAVDEHEVMLSRAKLAQMGINDPYVGMLIPLEFMIEGTNERFTEVFTLSAFYTEFVSAGMGNTFTPVFVSYPFAQRFGRVGYADKTVHVLFRSARNADTYATRLAFDLGLEHIHLGTVFTQGVNYSVMGLTLTFIILFLMLTGFMLIYNVMYLSVSKDIRFYGLLKTLGTTPRQLRRLVNGQVLWLYAPGVVVGLGLAAAISFALVPAFLTGIPTGTVVSFSPWIYAGGAVFTLLTALLGAYTSAKKAARISPVEAVRYAGEAKVRTRPLLSARGKPLRMAWRNVFRERKRAGLVLAGLFMGITVFALIMTFVNSMNIDGHLDHWHPHDIDILKEQSGVLDYEFAQQVAEIIGVVDVNIHTNAFASIQYPSMSATVIGVDTAWLRAFAPNLPLDIASFERGEIALVYQPGWMNAEQHIHLPDTFNVLIHDHDTPVHVTNGGALPRISAFRDGWGFGGQVRIVMSNIFLANIIDEPFVTALGVMVNPGMDEAVLAALTPMLGQFRFTNSRLEARQAMEDERFTMTVLGTGLSAILALIGIFNFINVMSVGLLVRRREFAALESVGMSKKQLRALVMSEGMIYWMLTLGLSATLGTAGVYGLMTLVINLGEAGFQSIQFPWILVLLVYAVIIVICTIVPLIANRNMHKLSLVERLRAAE